MRRNDFNTYITQNDFVGFFNELGWNHVDKSDRINPIVIEEAVYEITPVADKQGFKALICKVDDMPQNTVRRKIDVQLRRYFHNYILIFIHDTQMHHHWMVPVKTVDKRDIVSLEYQSIEQADFLFSKMSNLSFGLEEETNIVDVTLKVHGAFEINSANITKEFYRGFKKEHKSFVKFIEGIEPEGDRQWYASVMLNRLMFCYFIQKKGFLNFDAHYLRNKLNWTKEQQGEDKFFDTFYKGFLSQLFSNGLNSPIHDDEFEEVYGRIPYLNGGLFDEHELEKQYEGIDIPDKAFEELFDFFDKWRWHLDTRITATGKDINPDVLGYIFEQYINDRAQMGAYYTKEDITEYISKNTILPHLMDETAKTSSKVHFTPGGFVWEALRKSGDKYIYEAVKKGMDISSLPDEISIGLDTSKPDLLERRKEWNKPTPEEYALPTEIWRETIERRNRYNEVLHKIRNGEITQINDFITYNLDIRQFVEDLLIQTDDNRFILHFYHSLQNVSILDPTCGSGAFLFAALNILEPLYEVCIGRMQEFNEQNPLLFKKELDEINHKYRSNIQYFIYKSIILRNLYGVDIMHEATEIARLRLFLKMVAVVDVDRRADNLGLDPLPDIDFNIRCGNALVGYATQSELDNDLVYGDMFANQEFRSKIEDEMQMVSKAYERFKQIQFTQHENMGEFAIAKKELNDRLSSLNDSLHNRLYKATVSESAQQFDDWKQSHQPFHWLAEFYDIIHGNGGFDVIIGNPPYVVYNDARFSYKIGDNFKTYSCKNLYAYCVERSYMIINDKSRFGMIVPNSSISADKMFPLQKIIIEDKKSWISNYSWRPSKLFEGADMLLAIILTTKSSNKNTYSTIYNKWYNSFRDELFNVISYFDITDIVIEGSIPKLPSMIIFEIFEKMEKKSKNNYIAYSFKTTVTKTYFFYFRAVQYWFKILDREPLYLENGVQITTGEMKPIYTEDDIQKYTLISYLSSSLFFLNYIIWSSCQVVNSRDFNVLFDYASMEDSLRTKLYVLGEKLQDNYQENSKVVLRNYSKKGRTFEMEKQHFYIKLSKSIIDEIDTVLAEHYGFTEEELDFIINYDIKYRMGNELNAEEEE